MGLLGSMTEALGSLNAMHSSHSLPLPPSSLCLPQVWYLGDLIIQRKLDIFISD